jgi:hypothetical protein
MLFDNYDIMDHINNYGHFIIEDHQFRKMPEKMEIRLLTKFDNSNDRPKIFKKNELAILPVSRTKWIICSFEAYHFLEELEDDFVKVLMPSKIESVDFSNITSESVAINVAYISGIVEDFVEEKVVPTIDGRMGSGSFEFYVQSNIEPNKTKIEVNSSMIEIDAGYEGERSLILFEVKMNYSSNFLVRQLYYPFRRWNDNVKKNVRTIFLTYNKQIFDLYEYGFEDVEDYNSLRLIKKKSYLLIANDNLKVKDKIGKIEIEIEPTFAFPQANSFSTILGLLNEMKIKGKISKTFIEETYNLNSRQVNYYITACKYIGVVESIQMEEVHYSLNSIGKKIIKLDVLDFQIELVKLILKKEIFNKVYFGWILKNSFPTKDEILNLLVDEKFSKSSEMNATTALRRSSTVYSWSKWLQSLVSESYIINY